MHDGPHAIEELEIDLLLEGIFRRFGLDFRGYRRDALRAKLRAAMSREEVCTVSALQERVMHHPGSADALLRRLGSHDAVLYDDPAHYRAMREALVPWLRSCPSPRIWVAECAAPEEVCGLAILLEEEGLLERTQIFATCANEEVLQSAKAGRFPAPRLGKYGENYRLSGGRRDLRDYVAMEGEWYAFAGQLRDNVTWAQYNIATDASFNEFQLIACRGALAEFGNALRHRALRLFHDSMPVFGLLSLDGELSRAVVPFERCYRPLDERRSLYRRVA